MTLDTPMGKQDVEFEFATDGAQLSGKLSNPIGQAELTEGTIDGNSASWTAKVTSPVSATLKFKGTFDGDVVSGKMKIGPMPGGSFSGRRIG
jgi:hypothetical protein